MNRRLLLLKKDVLFQFRRSASNVNRQSSSEYCLDLVRTHDYENYLCMLLLPRDTRSAGLVIRAFNVELAHVQDQVHDKKIGEMRFTFWLNALNDTFNKNPPRSPVMMELHKVLCKHNLSKRHFKRLIESRQQHLSSAMFINMASVESYAEHSVSSIYYLLLELHGLSDLKTDHAASHLGKAHGIVTLLRSVPYNTRNRINVLPQDVLMKHNVSEEQILRRQINSGLQDAVCEVASTAKLHLDKAISLKKQIGRSLNTIFLPIVCLETYLEELRKLDFNIYHQKLHKRSGLLPFRLLFRKLFSQ